MKFTCQAVTSLEGIQKYLGSGSESLVRFQYFFVQHISQKRKLMPNDGFVRTHNPVDESAS